MNRLGIIVLAALALAACSREEKPADQGGIPLPKAWPRTEVYDTIYRQAFDGSDIQVNAGAAIIPDDRKGWINISYPAYRATLYLTDVWAPTAEGADGIEANRRERMDLNINGLRSVETSLSTPAGYNVTLLSTPSGTLTPLQFVARRQRRVVSGALVVDRLPVSADSIAPTLAAVEADIIHLVKGLK